MAAEKEDRCAEAKKFQLVEDAFRRGDLEGLRAALDDPNLVPHGRMPDAVGSCLVYAIYHSPQPFIPKLPEIGADPNAPVDDGFPPLIAALSCARDVPGGARRTDVDEILRLLLSFGADPNQRGINDYPPSTWRLPRAIHWRSKSFSMVEPILNCVRGSTSVKRRSQWRRRLD